MLSNIVKFFNEIKSKLTSMISYFTGRRYLKHLLLLIGFNSKDYALFQILEYSKRSSRGLWFGNNFLFPLLLVFFPITFTIAGRYFETDLSYNKSLIDLAITGSLSLIGFNILRTSLTFISEKLDESKIPEALKGSWPNVSAEIRIVKSRLKFRIMIFSVLAIALYIFQAGLFITNTAPYVYYFLIFVSYVTISSVVIARFIYLLETNFLDDDNVIGILFRAINTQSTEFQDLENELSRNGLLS